VSLAALLAVKPRCQPRRIYRVHRSRRRPGDKRKRIQYRPGLLGGFLASTGLDLASFSDPAIKDR
jgi:hypothetical protein